MTRVKMLPEIFTDEQMSSSCTSRRLMAETGAGNSPRIGGFQSGTGGNCSLGREFEAGLGGWGCRKMVQALP